MQKIVIMRISPETVVCLLLLIFVRPVCGAETFYQKYKAWEKLPARVLYDKGLHFMQQAGKPNDALACFTLLASRYPKSASDDSEKRICIAAMNTAGQIYMDYYHNLNRAYQLFLQSQEYSEEEGFDDISSFNHLCLANLGYLRSSLVLKGHDSKEVIANYKEAFWSAVRAKALNAIAPSLINMVYLSFAEGSVAETEPEINRFMKLDLPETTTSIAFARNLCMAMKSWIGNDREKALEYIDSMRTSIDKRQNERWQSSLLMIYYDTKYNYFRLSGLSDDAMRTLKTYEQAADSQNLDNDLLDIYRYYYLYNLDRGDLRSSNRYELAFYRLKDKVINSTGMPTLEQTRFLHELGRMQKQAEQDKVEKNIHMTILACLFIILLLMLVVLYQMYRKYKAEKENNRILYENSLKIITQEQQQGEKLIRDVPGNHDEQDGSRSKYVNSRMSEEEKDILFSRIRRIMATDKEIYSEQFSLARLSELLGEKENNISQTIGEKHHGNFYSLLCEYRIHGACRMLNSEQYATFTIEAIARSVGYKSRTNFAKNFKAVTGMTPSTYQKMTIKRLKKQ